MYPLLRSLEAQGLRRRRRGSTPSGGPGASTAITDAGRAERARLAAELGPRLDRIAGSIEAIRAEVLG